MNLGAGGKHWHKGLSIFLDNHLWRHPNEIKKGKRCDVIPDEKWSGAVNMILHDSIGQKVSWDRNKQEACFNYPWCSCHARRPGAHRALRSESLCRKDFSSQLSALSALLSALLIGACHESVSMHACLLDGLVDKLVIYYGLEQVIVFFFYLENQR